MSIIDSVFNVFGKVSEWFVETLPSLTSIFYNSTDNELTILGVMTIAGVGISVALLLFNYVKDLISFRG